MECEYCGDSINPESKTGKRFCSFKCAARSRVPKQANKSCPGCGNSMPQNTYAERFKKFCSSICCNQNLKRNITDKVRENGRKNGGYKPGSGIGKSGWYKGIWCDSSWELAFVMYHLDNGIHIVRNTTRYDYAYNGKVSKYIPDFIVDDKLIEIKGVTAERELAKIQQCPEDILLIDKGSIGPYLDYAIKTYGKRFIELYESKS